MQKDVKRDVQIPQKATRGGNQGDDGNQPKDSGQLLEFGGVKAEFLLKCLQRDWQVCPSA